MTREVGWYSAKFSKDRDPEIVFYNGYDCERNGFYDRMPEEFYWISDKKIMPEKMPMLLENGKYYVFETLNKDKHIGVYDSVSNAMCVGLKDWCVKRDNITILAGPFTPEELVNMKRL